MLRTPATAVVALALAACRPEAAPSASARGPSAPTTGPAPSASEVRAEPAPPSAAPVSSPAPAPAPPRFVLRELAPTQGDVTPLLKDEHERARAKGLVPVVEFYADWCPPCRVFDENLRTPEIAGALEGVYLVKLNMDDWHDKMKGTGYAPRMIPAFYFVGPDGRPVGKMLDGDRWKKASPAEIGLALKAFLDPAKKP